MRKTSKPIYQKYLTRDFTLGVIETWYKAESTDPRQWTKKQQPRHPYIIFIRNHEIVDCYYDFDGIAWVKREIDYLLENEKGFVDKVINNFKNRIDKMYSLFKKEPALEKEKFKVFTEGLRDVWVWFEALWWLIDLFEEQGRKKGLDKLLQMRKYGEWLAPSGDVIIRKSIKRLYPNLKAYTDVLLIDECLSGEIPAKQELAKRLESYIYTGGKLYTHARFQDIEKRYNIIIQDEKVDTNISEIKGETAYPGLVRGRARIVMQKKNINQVKKGETLIAPTTTPDYLPAIKKAVGIITDEGGILSHAAIISRELKIPCIIGTKIATKVLKDGDLVEVDADRGVVRIIR